MELHKGDMVRFYVRPGQREQGEVIEVLPVPASGDYPIVRISYAGAVYTRTTDDITVDCSVVLHLDLYACDELAETGKDIAQYVQRQYDVADWETLRP